MSAVDAAAPSAGRSRRHARAATLAPPRSRRRARGNLRILGFFAAAPGRAFMRGRTTAMVLDALLVLAQLGFQFIEHHVHGGVQVGVFLPADEIVPVFRVHLQFNAVKVVLLVHDYFNRGKAFELVQQALGFMLKVLLRFGRQMAVASRDADLHGCPFMGVARPAANGASGKHLS
jgi:hypothetical protein